MDFAELELHLNYLNNNNTVSEPYFCSTTELENVILLRYDPRVLHPKSGANLVWFYCIKNEEGVFTSIVEYRSNDLIWFTIAGYRRNNVLSSTLRNGILDMAKKRGWDGRISISKGIEFEASRGLADSLGFRKIELENLSVDFYKLD